MLSGVVNQAAIDESYSEYQDERYERDGKLSVYCIQSLFSVSLTWRRICQAVAWLDVGLEA